MTQTPGTAITPGTDLTLHLTRRKTSFKKGARAIGAGAIAAGLFGVFALPAYADTTQETLSHSVPTSQVLTLDSIEDLRIPDQRAMAEEQPAQVVVLAEEESAQRAQIEIPAGVGASGIVAAAYAQLGEVQDCTALVERSLRAAGFSVGDLGTSVGSWAQYGYVVTDGSLAPGDILVWPGWSVSIYVGDGMEVHGGWSDGGRHEPWTVLQPISAGGFTTVRVA